MEDKEDGARVVLWPEDEAHVRERVTAASDDAVALLLVGLVRSGAQLGATISGGSTGAGR